jgi:hypothetical protein
MASLRGIAVAERSEYVSRMFSVATGHVGDAPAWPEGRNFAEMPPENQPAMPQYCSTTGEAEENMRTRSVLVACALMLVAIAVSPAAFADDSWTMPNLIGKDLQGAQDAIQSLTLGAVFFSSSTDLTGQGRAQISDRNWVVCTSTPPPGGTLTTETEIDFGVVRIDAESCP